MYETLLARVPLFHGLSPRELTWLSGACREREYAAGEVLAGAGERIAILFILKSGSVQITRRDGASAEHPVKQLGPDAVIGEMALFDTSAQRESIVALEPTVALALPRWDFQATLRESPDIAIKLLDVISERLPHSERRQQHGTDSDPGSEA